MSAPPAADVTSVEALLEKQAVVFDMSSLGEGPPSRRRRSR